jgi:hypothetical protein
MVFIIDIDTERISVQQTGMVDDEVRKCGIDRQRTDVEAIGI